MQPSVTAPARRVSGLAWVALLLFTSLALIVTGVLTRPESGNRSSDADLPNPRVMARAALGIQPITATVAFWQTRVDQAPNDLPSRRLLAGALMTQARETGNLAGYETAEAEYRAAVAISPTSADAQLGLAGARAAQHDFSTAADLARQVLARDPKSVAALISLGDAQFELGRYTAARATLSQLATLLPDAAATLSRLARFSVLNGQPDRAVAQVRGALNRVGDLDQRRSDGAFFWFQLASHELSAGQPELAARHLEQGLLVDPVHLPSRELLARARAESGDLASARSLYLQLTRETPAADLFGDLAKVERAMGKRAAARAHRAEGLALGQSQLGRFASERRHLAAFFADADPSTGLTAAEQDYADRQDIQSAGALAWAEYRTGAYDSASRHSREALRFGTQDAVLQAQGGLIAAEQGERARAVRLLTAALDRRPNYDLQWAPVARAELDRLRAAS